MKTVNCNTFQGNHEFSRTGVCMFDFFLTQKRYLVLKKKKNHTNSNFEMTDMKLIYKTVVNIYMCYLVMLKNRSSVCETSRNRTDFGFAPISKKKKKS